MWERSPETGHAMMAAVDALALLPFSQHFPGALVQVTWIEVLQMAAERDAPPPSTRA
jgi:hypothetical protein